ncbi:MAG: YjjG family noncanonical pyrimidine nucleotidase [Crocinitomicaceae bacterium]
MKNLKHVFFDLDHTLWDFEKNSSEALMELYHELRLSDEIHDPKQFIAVYQEINAKYWHLYNHGKVSKTEVRNGRFLDTLNLFKVRNSEKKAVELGNEYVKRSPHKKHVFPHAHETLAYLNDKYALHIITNGFLEVQHTKLNNCNLSDYFDLILCTEEVGVNKPHPLVFETALKKTDAFAEESVMIGDNPETDIKGAKNCGLHTILFNPENREHDVETAEIKALNELLDLL